MFNKMTVGNEVNKCRGFGLHFALLKCTYNYSEVTDKDFRGGI